jgi:DNA-binding MarR family transcriptional regulator
MSDRRGRDNQEQVDREPLVQYEDLEQATGFTQISNAILRGYPELSDGEKVTYAVLKSFAYVSPETFVGEETLARARSCTVSTISRHLTKLIDVGLVRVRRRGQGKTNIWMITRIPREKLVEYLHEWRPNLKVRASTLSASQTAQTSTLQDPQIKTSQDSQIRNSQNPQAKTSANPQAEEEESEEYVDENEGRGTRLGNGSSSSGGNFSTTSQSHASDTYVHLPRIVENSASSAGEFSTIVENVEILAGVVAEYFEVPKQRRNIEGYLKQYDAKIAARALDAVADRLESGDEEIRNPVAYFYAVVRIMQAERDAAATDREQDEQERRLVAINWAHTLRREWPPGQVRAILVDTYRSEEFADEIMQEIG